MNLDEQKDELLVLESILDSDAFAFDNFSGEIRISANLKHAVLKIVSVQKHGHGTTQDYEVQHLPPFILSFSLPATYPSISSPNYTLSCVWLSRFQLNLLCDQLDDIWKNQEGCVVLYTWFQFLQDESLEFLGIADSLTIDYSLVAEESDKLKTFSEPHDIDPMRPVIRKSNRAIQDIQSKEEIIPLILQHDQTKKLENFNKTSFSCPICFENKIGTKCVQFSGCDHVFCKDCIVSYFSIHIQDGNIKALKCPTEKCNGQPLPKKIQELVSTSLYERYERLLLQTTLDTMEDIIYCPLLHCQSPVILEADSSIGQCPTCSYAFCPYCKLAYHGVSKCKVASHEMRQLCEQYEIADHEERTYLEKRYGKKVITTAIEESKSQAWMKTNTKPCPSCEASIEKLDGCNKMTCYKCRAYFCWLCLRLLDPSNPYRHFNNTNSPCFNKLFMGANFEVDQEFELWI